MGAGSKLDPTRIQITDISLTTEDSLSRLYSLTAQLNRLSGDYSLASSSLEAHKKILLKTADQPLRKLTLKELVRVSIKVY